MRDDPSRSSAEAPELAALLDDILAITARTRRRPAWRIPAWWLPMGPVLTLEAEPRIALFATRLVFLLMAILAVATTARGSG